MRIRYCLAAALALVTTAACVSSLRLSSGAVHDGVTGSPDSTAAAVVPNWPTYHGDAQRTGLRARLPLAGKLAIAWSRQLDGAVYGQPLIIGDTVVAATEGDRIYGLSRATGQVLWRSRLLGQPVPLSQQPCGNINPLGITGTPVYDATTGLVYAVAETTGGQKVLAGVRVSNGTLAVRRLIPAPDGQPAYDQQRGALALENGRIYITFGGHFGDCGLYIGSVVAVRATGSGRILSYKVPTKRQAGLWASAGPVISPGGTIYVSSGNGAATQPPYDGSDSVIALTPQLRQIGVFAPRTWAQDNASDLDIGSASPALLANGTILQVGKRGTGYLLPAGRLGGIGSQLAQGRVCASWGGDAVDGSVVYVPCNTGVAAVNVANGQFHVLWRGPSTAAGSPVVGGGAVWVADWNAGVLYELNQATGAVRYRLYLGSSLPNFVSPSLSGHLLLIGTMHGVVAVRGA